MLGTCVSVAGERLKLCIDFYQFLSAYFWSKLGRLEAATVRTARIL